MPAEDASSTQRAMSPLVDDDGECKEASAAAIVEVEMPVEPEEREDSVPVIIGNDSQATTALPVNVEAAAAAAAAAVASAAAAVVKGGVVETNDTTAAVSVVDVPDVVGDSSVKPTSVTSVEEEPVVLGESIIAGEVDTVRAAGSAVPAAEAPKEKSAPSASAAASVPATDSATDSAAEAPSLVTCGGGGGFGNPFKHWFKKDGKRSAKKKKTKGKPVPVQSPARTKPAARAAESREDQVGEDTKMSLASVASAADTEVTWESRSVAVAVSVAATWGALANDTMVETDIGSVAAAIAADKLGRPLN